MITEDYVSFKTAKLLKEKGFDEICKTAYETITNEHKIEECSPSDWGKLNQVKRPTLQMAMKWLRKEHNLHFMLSPFNRNSNPLVVYYDIDVVKPPEFLESFYSNIDKDQLYEEACEDAVKYCLENLI